MQVEDFGVEIANRIRRGEYLGGGDLREHRPITPLAEILREPGRPPLKLGIEASSQHRGVHVNPQDLHALQFTRNESASLTPDSSPTGRRRASIP
jgi:hypothetical protein